MKSFVPAFIAVFCIVIGGLAGSLLRSAGQADAATAIASAEAAPSGEAADGSHGSADETETASTGHGGKEKAGHDDHGSGKSKGNLAYFKFTREFVVPLISNERVSSLVILNLSLETDTTKADNLYLKEPLLRDSIMTTLIEIAGDGRTFQRMTSIENYETIRSMVLVDLQKRLPDQGIRNVLIMDIARQDF